MSLTDMLGNMVLKPDQADLSHHIASNNANATNETNNQSDDNQQNITKEGYNTSHQQPTKESEEKAYRSGHQSLTHQGQDEGLVGQNPKSIQLKEQQMQPAHPMQHSTSSYNHHGNGIKQNRSALRQKDRSLPGGMLNHHEKLANLRRREAERLMTPSGKRASRKEAREHLQWEHKSPILPESEPPLEKPKKFERESQNPSPELVSAIHLFNEIDTTQLNSVLITKDSYIDNWALFTKSLQAILGEHSSASFITNESISMSTQNIIKLFQSADMIEDKKAQRDSKNSDISNVEANLKMCLPPLLDNLSNLAATIETGQEGVIHHDIPKLTHFIRNSLSQCHMAVDDFHEIAAVISDQAESKREVKTMNADIQTCEQAHSRSYSHKIDKSHSKEIEDSTENYTENSNHHHIFFSKFDLFDPKKSIRETPETTTLRYLAFMILRHATAGLYSAPNVIFGDCHHMMQILKHLTDHREQSNEPLHKQSNDEPSVGVYMDDSDSIDSFVFRLIHRATAQNDVHFQFDKRTFIKGLIIGAQARPDVGLLIEDAIPAWMTGSKTFQSVVMEFKHLTSHIGPINKGTPPPYEHGASCSYEHDAPASHLRKTSARYDEIKGNHSTPDMISQNFRRYQNLSQESLRNEIRQDLIKKGHNSKTTNMYKSIATKKRGRLLDYAW